MKNSTIKILLAACAASGALAGVHAENAVYSCTGANGVAELTNAPNGNVCEKMFSGAAAVSAAPAARTVDVTVAAQDANAADAGEADAAAARKAAAEAARAAIPARLAQRREDAIAQSNDAYATDSPAVGLNPAVNRRYLMTSRAAYQRAIGFAQNQ